jgi:hypothetical protein
MLWAIKYTVWASVLENAAITIFLIWRRLPVTIE